MANWDRKYNSPTVWLEPYTVEITRPAGWKASKTAVANGMDAANIAGTIPGETYELPYKKDASVATGGTDVWKLGPVFKASAERTAKLKVRNTSGTPPTDPIVQDLNKPKLRDGGGGGLEEGGKVEGFRNEGIFEIVVQGKKYAGRFKLGKGKIVFDNGFTDPSPLDLKKRKATKKTVAKRKTTKGRGK